MEQKYGNGTWQKLAKRSNSTLIVDQPIGQTGFWLSRDYSVTHTPLNENINLTGPPSVLSPRCSKKRIKGRTSFVHPAYVSDSKIPARDLPDAPASDSCWEHQDRCHEWVTRFFASRYRMPYLRQVSKWPPLRTDPRRALRDSVKSITLDVESENVGRIQIAVVVPQPWLQLT